ncbi:MAG: hypothetical protein JKX76_03250 [Colwellia sp.]|nr:hypothetical protein [Colwellia sp.]
MRKGSLSAKSSALSLISTEENKINYIAVATAGNISGDLERKFTLGPAVELLDPIDVQDVMQALPPKLRQHVYRPQRRVSGIPPVTWISLLAVVRKLGKIKQKEINHLNDLIASRNSLKKVSLNEVVGYEHDAVAVSLEAFQGSQIRQRYLSDSPVNSSAPFIKAFEKSGATVLEDHMIDNDLSSFPGVKAMRRHLVGAVQIETESGSLTIINSNRTRIERTLGVDLIYYHHTYQSFVLVQYKRLTGERDPIYRPNSDSSYIKELDRMRCFMRNNSPEGAGDHTDYRMEDNPFYFKFCNSRPKEHWSRMSPGMYIPLGLWEEFILSPEALGPNGGLFIGYENAQRWLCNSEFVKLVRKGWIGSRGNASSRLNAIIEQQLLNDKSVIVAIHQDKNSTDDHLRDAMGRFAAEDDLDAI